MRVERGDLIVSYRPRRLGMREITDLELDVAVTHEEGQRWNL
jgi:hypothetical protein